MEPHPNPIEANPIEEKLQALRSLEQIIERLRAPNGCPWDREQTLRSMAPKLVEEACEALDAVEDAGGAAAETVCEELGDTLMNILLIARIAEEGGGFNLATVAERIAEKLVRRHPHVFGDERAATVGHVLERWNAIKAEEQRQKSNAGGAAPSASRLGQLPRSLPALTAAARLGEKAASLRFDWPDAQGALAKVAEELGEVERALGVWDERRGDAPAEEALSDEIGDLLFAVVNVSRKCGVDPERALRTTMSRFRRRFEFMERHVDLTRATLAEMEAQWVAAKGKKNERGDAR